MNRIFLMIVTVVGMNSALALAQDSAVSGLQQQQIKQTQEQVRALDNKFTKKSDELANAAEARIKGVEAKADVANATFGNLSTHSCDWMAYVSKWHLEVEFICPAGQFMNGIRFKHLHGQNGTHEESVSIRCCSVRPQAAQ